MEPSDRSFAAPISTLLLPHRLPYEPPHTSPPADHVLAELQLYGCRPIQDERPRTLVSAAADDKPLEPPQTNQLHGLWEFRELHVLLSQCAGPNVEISAPRLGRARALGGMGGPPTRPPHQ